MKNEKKSSFDWFARYTVTTIAYNEIARKYKGGKTIETRGKKKNEMFDRKRNDSRSNIILFVMISFHRGGSART